MVVIHQAFLLVGVISTCISSDLIRIVNIRITWFNWVRHGLYIDLLTKLDYISIMNYYKHLSKQQQQAIIHCYESGKSTDGVGEQFGCSRSTVCNILKKFGIPARSASHYTTCTRRTALTQDNKDLIDGLLLSDASISKRI